jgi:hypothetical protein
MECNLCKDPVAPVMDLRLALGCDIQFPRDSYEGKHTAHTAPNGLTQLMEGGGPGPCDS